MTEKQKAFLSHLFDDDVNGNYREAARKAGYSDKTTIAEITSGMEDQITEASKKYLSQLSVQAAVAMKEIMNKPHMPGTPSRLATAKDLLDRAGLGKTEKVEIESKGGIFFLPSKKEEDE